jgi:hypothetical protein
MTTAQPQQQFEIGMVGVGASGDSVYCSSVSEAQPSADYTAG